MSKFIAKVEHLPTVKEYKISVSDLKTKLQSYEVEWKKFDFDDIWYYHTDWEGWGKIFDNVFVNLPKYLTDKFDCDNFAREITCRVASRFKFNLYGRLEGLWKGKRHKWGLFFDGDDCYQQETQNRMVYDMESKLYVPDEILIG